jgi:hypothetical protein
VDGHGVGVEHSPRRPDVPIEEQDTFAAVDGRSCRLEMP